MKTVLLYLLMYAFCYFVFVGLSLAVSGDAHWLYCAGLLIWAALMGLFINWINPGYEQRMVNKYGTAGIRLGEKMRKRLTGR